MTTNAELVAVFQEIADLLDLGGERFKPEAYRRAARSIESLAEDIRQVSARGQLETVPGVGEAIAEKIREYLRDGKLSYLERLRAEYPPGILELMRLPGIGPKTARRFWVELGVEGPGELKSAIAAGRLNGVKGFGAKKIAQFSGALDSAGSAGRRLPLRTAFVLAERIVAYLRAHAPIAEIVPAGSLRRRREDVGDIDILVTSKEPERVFEAFSAFPGRTEIRVRGSTKETIVVEGSVQVDLRVVEPAAFGAALQYFTGSKDHNVTLRTRARDLGLKVNEYGVFRGEARIAGATEEEVYRALGLPLIPPELRENRGEVEAALAGRLPAVVGRADLHGDLHLHLPETPDHAQLRNLVDRTVRDRLSYLGVILPTGADATVATLRRLLPPEVELLLGTEEPERPLGGGEYRVRRLDRPAGPARKDGASFAAHPPPARSGPAAWVSEVLASPLPVDIGPDGPDAGTVRRLLDGRVPVHLSVLASEGDVDLGELALGTARRAGAVARQVLNAAATAPKPASAPAKARPARRRS